MPLWIGSQAPKFRACIDTRSNQLRQVIVKKRKKIQNVSCQM